jgi:hypothetical protein
VIGRDEKRLKVIRSKECDWKCWKVMKMMEIDWKGMENDGT